MPKAAFDPAAFIRDLEKRCRGKNFLYRGQDEAYQPEDVPAGELWAESTLRRDLLNAGMPVTKSEIKKWEQRILVGARTRFPPHTADAEVWTALRHAGGMTNSIDFTTRLLVGLWFAVQGVEKDGVLFLLEDEGRLPAPALSHDILAASSRSLSSGARLVESSHTSDHRFRPQRQASVFVQAPYGCLSLPKCTHTITIPSKHKCALRDHLENLKDRLTHHNLFPDLLGLVALELESRCRLARREDFERVYDNLENLLRYRNRLVTKGTEDALYLRGQVHYFRGDYVRALRDFNRARPPARPEAGRELHLFLSSTYIHLGEYQKAIDELGKFPEEARDDLEHYMLAEAHYQKAKRIGSFSLAQQNIQCAIHSNAHRPIYFRAQITYEAAAGRYTEARKAAGDYRNAFQDDRAADAMLAEIDRCEETARRK